MAFPNHTATEIITAAARYSPSVTTAKQQNAVNSTEPPEDATVTFTQQDAPLLRIPGELRNRIYHEIFRATFDELEMNKEAQKRCDPKVLRPALAGLMACRQISPGRNCPTPGRMLCS